jgi:hypothetical protein
MVRVCLGCILYTAPGALAAVDRSLGRLRSRPVGLGVGPGCGAHGAGCFAVRRLGVGPGCGAHGAGVFAVRRL